MTESGQNAERVEGPDDRETTITDTIPVQIFPGVEKYYERHGYLLQRFVLVTSGNYEAVFKKQEGRL